MSAQIRNIRRLQSSGLKSEETRKEIRGKKEMKAVAQFRHRLAWCITMLALAAVPCFAQNHRNEPAQRPSRQEPSRSRPAAQSFGSNSRDIADPKPSRVISRDRNVVISSRGAINLAGRRTMDRRSATFLRLRSGISSQSSNQETTCPGHISRRRKVIIRANG